MKKMTIPLFAITFAIHLISARAESYSLIGQRHLRLYTAPQVSQAYNAGVEAQKIADSLCKVPWTKAQLASAEATSHVESQLDSNVMNRDLFDAALFCAHHTNETHRAYANAAVYRYRLPEGSLPHLTRLTANVSSDPYNALGARIVLYTNSTGEIPMDCATCRGDVTGGIKLSGVAPRVTRKVDGKDYWYPNTTNAVFTQSVQLQKYLFVFVLMENYASSRGNWLEGCSYMKNLVSIETDAAVPGWSDGSTVNLMEIDTATGDDSLEDLMAYYETTQTVVTATHLASGRVQQFAAPSIAYRKISVGSTNLTSITHAVLPYGDIFVRGTNAVLSSGWRATAVLGGQRVAVIHADVRADRGFESYPPTKPFTQLDRTFVGLPSGSPDTDGDGIADGWELYVGADPTDRSDGMSDWDNDGLTLAEEFDHGYWPTDPRNGMSFGDCLLDFHVYRYHLKGGDAEKDFDGDGLPNFAEYLISEIFKEATLDPDNPKTDGVRVDYFRKMGDLYLGEIFTDHDMIPWEWEQKYFSAANPSVFDPYRDDDLDGWPNFDEFMAGTDPTTPECPVPEVRMRVLYNAKSAFRPPVVVKAWNEVEDPGANYMPDAIWTLTNDFYRSRGWITLPNQDRGTSSLGHLRKGKTTFIVYAASPEGSYIPGSPLGVVRGVDIGWKNAKFQVTLSTSSTLCPDRMNVFAGLGADELRTRGISVDNSEVIFDKVFKRPYRDFVCEQDFFDKSITFNTGDASKTNREIQVQRFTEGTWQTVGTTYRRFEGTQHKPNIVFPTDNYVFSASPTFRWSTANEEEHASNPCTSYTLFRLQILETDKSTVVYDSGIRSAPAQTADGSFEWTADAFVGDNLNAGMYTWKVAMYNDKFNSDLWSNVGVFSIVTGMQQDMDDHNHCSIDASVKYTGPNVVLTRTPFVLVQAFETADFSGTPIAQARITDIASVRDATDIRKNCTLVGLPFGTFYVRAYIDYNGNRIKDSFESWGFFNEPIELKRNQPAPVVCLYIEDSDTDNDCLPDAWEYAKYGNLETKGAETDEQGHIAIKTTTYDEIAVGIANFSKFLSGASLTFFQNIGNVSLALGLEEVTEKTIHELRETITSNIVERINQ